MARQMDKMQALQALQEEQRKAGMLLDDGAPVKLSVLIAPAAPKEAGPKEKATTLFGQEEEDEEAIRKRKVRMPKLDLAEGSEKGRSSVQRMHPKR